jgi:hypothetical protein
VLTEINEEIGQKHSRNKKKRKRRQYTLFEDHAGTTIEVGVVVVDECQGCDVISVLSAGHSFKCRLCMGYRQEAL